MRREDEPLLRGEAQFVADVELADAAFVHYVTSTVAHATIASLDTTAAAAAPGVVAVFTAADLDLGNYPAASPDYDPAMARPLLATDRVRFVGEALCTIVAEDAAAARDAAELVEVDYEMLPTVVDPEAALAPDAPRLFDDSREGNVVCRLEAPDLTADFDACEAEVTVRSVNNRLAPAPLETRVAAAYWGDDGRLHCINAGQGVYPVRAGIAAGLGLEPDDLHVVSRDVGGSFGAKARPHPEEMLLGWIAKRVGRPVIWVPSRSDDMVGLVHGRGQVQYLRIGGTRDGKITAYHLRVVQESGAYASMGAGLPGNARAMLTGCYEIPTLEFSSASVVTNTTPVGPYRGAGRPEAAAAIERAVDAFAVEIEMDPAEVRRRNFIAPSEFPLVTATGTPYDSGAYEASLDAALEAADYDALRATQRERRAAGDTKLLGIGIATYVERTAGIGRSEYGAVELRPGGHIVGRTGSSPYGQGHHTSWSMLISDRTGVPMSHITIVHGDTDRVPAGGVTGGSRSVQLAGAAIWEASATLVAQAREAAANLLEAATDDVELDTSSGAFSVVGTPARSVTWADVADHLLAGHDETGHDETGHDEPEAESLGGPRLLHAEERFESEGPTFPFGTHVAVVEVDAETGEVTLVRLVACDDAGTILNPLLAGGQVHGGLAQGAAQALMEEFIYDEDGNPLTGNFADYPVISAAELPSFELVPLETPTHINPLGAKGIGESGTVGSTPAIHNAVIDALSHLGVRHLDMPLTPRRVWEAIEAADVR